MRIVLDTNVLIAALIARGVCADLVEHCILRHEVVVSDFILDELHDCLLRKFHFMPTEADQACELYRRVMQVIAPQPLSTTICRDPDDDMILATAITGNADCIVTGDRDLTEIGQFQGIAIVRPGDFPQHEDRHE
jgi:uncharacterized protein